MRAFDPLRKSHGPKCCDAQHYKVVHIVLPAPVDDQLSDANLERIAGGARAAAMIVCTGKSTNC
jgi:hypothetical protein